MASGVHVAPYSKTAIAEGLPHLRALMADPEEARKVPRILATMGIRFMLLEPLSGSLIDGAALWLPDNSPLVAVSTRFDRIDSFWFTLCHELAHIEAEDQQGSLDKGALDTDLIGKKRDTLEEVEQRADDRASEMLIPQDRLASFIARKRPYFYKEYIIQFARTVGVHPGIVIGQLQYRGEIGYYANREMLVKIRDVVAQEALTDGWGHTLAGF
jgi:HTH-type transcriptional regulator/antitoxin HigA